MRKWLQRLLGRSGTVHFAGFGPKINVDIARHSDTPGLVTMIVKYPSRVIEISMTPFRSREIANALFDAARDAQEGVPLEDEG